MEPSERLTSKPPCYRADAEAVVRRLRENGHVAYFAGGCVRDLLLGLEPKDFDVATDAPPKRVRQLFTQTQAVGAAFGVILVRHGESVIEVATFRAEGTYTDGRRPDSVRFTNAEEDARRRDFTINGLFLDPVTNDVIDYVGGRKDLESRVLRAIGDPNERFAEDSLRLLRAVRFAARFSLHVEQGTAAAIRQHAPTLVRISPERIADEFRLMMTPPYRVAAWPMLWEMALVEPIFRFLPGGEAPTFEARRSLLIATAPGRSIPFGLALAAAALCYQGQGMRLDDVRPLLERARVLKAIAAMRQGLRISNDETAEMQGILEGVSPLLADVAPSLARIKRFLATPTAEWARDLLRAVRSLGVNLERIEWLEREFEALRGQDVNPAPLVTGDDLTAAGLNPGPVFKRILDGVYDAQLEGRVSSKTEGMRMAMELAKG